LVHRQRLSKIRDQARITKRVVKIEAILQASTIADPGQNTVTRFKKQ